MQELIVYENTFNHFYTVKRRYRRMAVASFVFSLGVLVLYLVQLTPSTLASFEPLTMSRRGPKNRRRREPHHFYDQTAYNNRWYRWLALVSAILAAGVLTFYRSK